MDENQNLPQSLIDELTKALSGMNYGSIELYIQDNTVTQITVRNIKKTSVRMKNSNHISASPINRRISTQGKIHIKLRP